MVFRSRLKLHVHELLRDTCTFTKAPHLHVVPLSGNLCKTGNAEWTYKEEVAMVQVSEHREAPRRATYYY